MKKIFTSLAVICMLCLAVQPLFSKSHPNITALGKDDKTKNLKIVSSRKSGDVQLRFTAEKAGEATIKVLNATGKVVLQQTSHVAQKVNTISLKKAIDLEEGLYTVQLDFNQKSNTTQFLIWK